MDVSLSELRELVVDREAWHAAIHGFAKSWTRLSDWTELMEQRSIFVLLVLLFYLETEVWSRFLDMDSGQEMDGKETIMVAQ